MMLERNDPIHSIIFFDTGWEFPEMNIHIDKLEKHIGLKVERIHPRKPFNYLMLEHPVKRRATNQIRGLGYGWPSVFRRWCTREKVSAIHRHVKSIENKIQVIGIAADEAHRTKIDKGVAKRYPLIEWDITEKQALQYCYEKGFDWGGLYEIFDRVSCFCCPLQRISDLRKLRKHRPELWDIMLKMDKKTPKEYRPGFKDLRTVHDFEKRFSNEDRQMEFDFMQKN